MVINKHTNILISLKSKKKCFWNFLSHTERPPTPESVKDDAETEGEKENTEEFVVKRRRRQKQEQEGEEADKEKVNPFRPPSFKIKVETEEEKVNKDSTVIIIV